MRVQALHAACASRRRHLSARAAPTVDERVAPRGIRVVRRGERRGVHGVLEPPDAAGGLEPATWRTRSGSTSHSVVGIGVPSSSHGAFWMTTGAPSGRRTDDA